MNKDLCYKSDEYCAGKIATLVGVSLERLSEDAAVRVKNKIVERFAKPYSYPGFLWERIRRPCVVAYERVGPDIPHLWPGEFARQFFADKPIFICFYEYTQPTMSVFRFDFGRDVDAVLGYEDYIHFNEFCITDENYSFLLIYSGEPCFIACGSAMRWLEEKVRTLKAEGKDVYGSVEEEGLDRKI